MENPILDRIPSKPDPIRQSRFSLGAFEVEGISIAEQEPRSYTWWVPFHLNQQREGACVPHGCVHEALARPKPVDFRFHPLPGWATNAKHLQDERRFSNQQIAQALAIKDGYDWCRDNDEFAGSNYSGTSSAAGAKMMAELKLWGEYRWASSVKDFMTGISRHGPGTLAIDWYTGMMSPDSEGFIHPTGVVEGGHQILAMSVQLQPRYFKQPIIGLWQSWGDMPVWWITQDELEQIVSTNGEMAIPVTRFI